MTDRERYDRMLAATPNASQTRSKAPGKVGPRDLRDGYPLFMDGGESYRARDTEGRWYVDFVGANAAIPLGYNHPTVTNAIMAEIGQPLLSLPSMLEAEVAERLMVTFPCCGQARFVKTGSEATTAALAIARAATGRREVWVGDWSYHGWHDWARCRPKGEVVEYALNDFAAIGKLVDEPPAALFFEPPRWHEAARHWLSDLMDAARSVGTIVVFDELVQAFRLRLAGGQEYYGVVPDLACIGKALGNGYPIAAVIGPPDLMRYATSCVSSTHGGERVALAAARAVLDIYEHEPALARLWDCGQAFWNAFAEAASGARLEGTPVHFRIRIDVANEGDALDRALVCAARDGVLFHRDACNASAVMPPDEAARSAKVLVAAIEEAVHGIQQEKQPQHQD